MGCRMAYGYAVIFFYLTVVIIAGLAVPESRLYVLGSLVLIVAGVLLFRRYRARPAIFITDARVIERSIFGVSAVDAAGIASYQRQIVKYRDRYGNVQDVATNNVVLLGPAIRKSVGPVADYEGFTSLLDGLLTRDIDPTKMRGLDPVTPATAETREDLFVAVSNWTEGDLYGPLVVGKRGLVRFTEKLSPGLEGLILTVLAQPASVEDLESKIVFLSRRPDAGHVTLVDLLQAELGMDSTSLRVKTAERTLMIQLADADAMRCRKFLQAR